MVDLDTFVTTVYVLADDYCKAHEPGPVQSGRAASLSPGEVVALAIVSQWACFASERGFYRYATTQLRSAFPTLPDRSQFNRLVRQHVGAITRFALHLADDLTDPVVDFEILDCTAVRTRNLKRRGRGWLVGWTAIGKSGRLGWYEGLKLLLAITRRGVIRGFGCGPANADDRTLAETVFVVRERPDPRLPSVGRAASDIYLADGGFASYLRQLTWHDELGIDLLAPPQGSLSAWPRAIKRRLIELRQVIESVNNNLLHPFRLDDERPHDLVGLNARLAAKVGLHHVCIWLNRSLGQPWLATAALIDW
jgi:Transposase DDE domain